MSSASSTTGYGARSTRPDTGRACGLRGPGNELVERMPAGARALGDRVVDREPRGLERVHEVDLGFRQVGDAHPVDHDADAELLLGDVLFRELVVQVHRVPQA